MRMTAGGRLMRAFRAERIVPKEPIPRSSRWLTSPPLKAVAARDQCADLAVGDTTLEHPETAIGMNVADAAGTDDIFRALDPLRNRISGFDDG